MSYEHILLESVDGVATLTLNRPAGLNSLNKGLIDDIRTALRLLAKGPTTAFGEIKRALDAAAYNTLDEQLELERRTQQRLGDMDDFREGVAAFLTKREPEFTGK